MPDNASRPRDASDLPLAPLETTGVQGKVLDVLAVKWAPYGLRCWLSPSGLLHVSIDGDGGRRIAKYTITQDGTLTKR